jgi:aldehyde dehydrogenase (NAD+)
MSSSSSTPVFTATPVATIAALVADARAFHETHATLPLAWRKTQLRALYRMVKDNETALCEAVHRDVGVEHTQVYLRAIALIYNDISLALRELDSWAAPVYPSVELAFKLDNAQIRPDPKGVVANIAPWNYPLQLSVVPLIGAIAAGCCMILKPSELAEHTAALLADLVPRYLEPRAFKVVNGAVAETTALLEQKFDHILYTGNSQVARIIAAAAAKHLTPTTLELGGKSPAIVDDKTNLPVSARRIAWGAFTNSGQTCIRPDYIICTPALVAPLVAELKAAAAELFGDHFDKDDFRQGRIINARHYARVAKLLADTKGKVEFGGQLVADARYIAPTVVSGCAADDSLMQTEIFGPLLPIVTCDSHDEMIAYVNRRDKPLACYVFTQDDKFAERVLRETSSGGAVVNDVIMHCVVPQLPFGGIGESGMGAYHGKFSFDMFSHQKAILKKSFMGESLNALRYPPITEKKLSWMRMAMISEPKESKWFGFW